VPFKTTPCSFFFFLEKEKRFGGDPKMGYDSCPPLYNAYGAKTLHSKLVKKIKGNKMIWFILGNLPTHAHSSLFSGATCPHTHTGLFSWATCPHTLTLVYFHGRPAQLLKVIYFQGRPTHTLTLTLVYFHGRPAQVEKRKSGLIVMGDLPRWRNGLIVMGDLPKNGKKVEWSSCNGWPTQVDEWPYCNGWPTQIKTWRMVEL